MNINATLLGQTLAFVIFVAICWKWVWPPILAIMEEREKRISDGLEAAKKAKDSLTEAQQEYDAEISKAKAEAATILEKANERASTIVGEAKNKAELEAEKIISTANKNLEAEINKTKAQLKQDLGQIVVDTAQKIIEEEISADKHEKNHLRSSGKNIVQELIPSARPYAKATFQAALDAGQHKSLAGELTLLKEAYKEKAVLEMVSDPSISREAAAAKLAELFSSELSQISKNLIATLGKNDRLELLPSISEIFDLLLREHNKSKMVEVSLGYLTPDIEQALSKRITEKYGDCEITFNQSEELMGGFLIKIGDEVLDLSIKGRIQKLVNQLNI